MISLSTGTLWPYGLNRIFKIAKESQFDSLELILVSTSSNAYIDTWDAVYINQLIKEYKITVSSVHAHFEFEIEQDNFKDIINLTNSIGATNIIVHIPREDQLNYIQWFNDKYYNYHQKIPYLLAENVHHKIGKADPILKTVNEFNKLPNMCFDVAHALRSGVNPKKAIFTLDNITQIHLSDWDGKEDHMSILKRKKYYSDLLSLKIFDKICLELCPKIFNNVADQKEIIRTLNNERNFVNKIITSETKR